MLYSQGFPEPSAYLPDGGAYETDHRKIWQTFAEHFHLFRGTPTGLWLTDEMINVFGVTEKLTGESAQRITITSRRNWPSPILRPGPFKRFNVEVLCTTDAATDDLSYHKALQDEGWGHRVRPTFRPDAVVNLDTPGWHEHIRKLSEASGIDVTNYDRFIAALENRRAYFKQMGATATDHAAVTADTEPLSHAEASKIFDSALRGQIDARSAARFTAHMLHEMARMSSEDGLVMQLHVGSFRNHNRRLFERFGPDRGADIPVATEWTRALLPLLNSFGTHPNFRVIVFTLDESTYSRELAPCRPLPAMLLGPPWWFFDSVKGMERYLDASWKRRGSTTRRALTTTRAFPSIPARHDVWRRVTCNWLAGQVVTGLIDEEDAAGMAYEFAYGLAKRAYRLP